MAQNAIDHAIQSQSWLDQLAGPLQRFVRNVLEPGPTGTPLRNILHGTFLGHPLHPVLTDVPTGSWTAAVCLDLLSYLPFVGKGFGASADAAITLGLVSVPVTAASGLADWSHARGHVRRVGLVHALSNVTATLLYLASMMMRARGNRSLGRGVGFLGYGVVTFGAYLGGDLVYRYGMSVAPTAFEEPSEEWTDVGEESALGRGQLRKVQVGGQPVLLARDDGGQVSAIADTCTHMGCSLAEGKLDGTTITCPCHGSQFDVTTGLAVRGPASVPEPRYDVSILAGRIKLRAASPK